MAQDLISLVVILAVAVASPIVARLIPGGLVPEVVLELAGGALLGAHGAGVIVDSDSLSMLSQLGLAFLFLLAGYEIDPQILKGHVGRAGCVTWFVTFAIALGLVFLVPAFSLNGLRSVAVAICLCTTALGTLIPILTERGLAGTPVGDAILAYGTWGELMPILAMALLMSSRAGWQTMLVLGVFFAVCVMLAVLPRLSERAGSVIYRVVHENISSDSHLLVRITSLLLVALVALSVVADLDAVLGSFAAGFVLRYIIPEGNEALEDRLGAIGYGFFIPVFFVMSGTRIDLRTIGANPAMLATFIVLLLAVRALPVFVGLSVDTATSRISVHHRVTIALYCTTALPLIVAVTNLAVSSEQMTQQTASVLVAAGAVSVFLMPLLGSITYRIADAHPLQAARRMWRNPSESPDIVREHRAFSRLLSREEHLEKRAGADDGGARFGPQVFAADARAASGGEWSAWDKALEEASGTPQDLPAAPAPGGNAGTRAREASGAKAPAEPAARPKSEADRERLELARRVIAERRKRLEELGLDPDRLSRNPRSDQFLTRGHGG